jgi:hypothetical protein
MNEITRIQPAESAIFELQQRQAKMFAVSALVPEHLRKGDPQTALANCYIALKLAEVMGEAPLVVMQNIHIVKGKAGFAAQYMIARANSSGIFTGRIDWRIDKSDPKNLSITAFAHLRETGDEVSFTCDMAMAKAEGWTSNPKYTSMPELMLRYRSATFLVRLYAPDVMLGYQTVEEVQDTSYTAVAVDEAPRLTAAMLADQAGETIDADPVEVADDEPEGPADEQLGERFNGTDPADGDTIPAWMADDQRIRDLLSTSQTMADIKEASAELDKVRVTIPDEHLAVLDSIVAAARKQFAAA